MKPTTILTRIKVIRYSSTPITTSLGVQPISTKETDPLTLNEAIEKLQELREESLRDETT